MIGQLRRAIVSCRRCGLFAQCKLPVPPLARRSPFMVVGRNPGENENMQGEPFVGEAGRLLDEFIAATGWHRDGAYITNVVKCFTARPQNRAPTLQEIRACSVWLNLEFQLVQPQVVLAVGTEAIHVFNENVTPGRVVGDALSITDPFFEKLCSEYETTVFGLYHPSYVLRGGMKREEYLKLANVIKPELERFLRQ